MGLCKCPKRKVTNLFCFEHRVNVCEHCLVANHPKCIVQSYLHWLQDSDYNPSCLLCNGPLDDEARSECARLLCYDVFHWSCLNDYAQRLPPNTAPAGYQCPTCKAGLFPPANVASPVAETLRQYLLQVNWARTGLGLPLIEERSTTAQHLQQQHHLSPAPAPRAAADALAASSGGGGGTAVGPRSGGGGLAPSTTQPPSAGVGASASSSRLVSDGSDASASAAASSRPVHPVQPVQSASSSSSAGSAAAAAYPHQNFTYTRAAAAGDAAFGTRKNLDGVPLAFSMTIPAADHDDNKYKRRSAFHFLSQWFKSLDSKGAKGSSASTRMKPTYKRFLVVLFIGFLGFFTLMLVFSILGRRVADSDPMLDPRANPNIMVQAADGAVVGADGPAPEMID